jgi:hypothetical protein
MKVLFILGLVALASAIPHKRQCPEPTPDPSIIDVNTSLNLTAHPIFRLNPGASHQGGASAGHSTAVVEVEIVVITLTATLHVTIETIELSLNGIVCNGYLDFSPFTSIPSGNFSTTGSDLTLSVAGVVADGSATLFINLITNKVSIREMEVESIDWTTLCTDFGPNFMIGGSPVDWADLCQSFKPAFMAEFNNPALKDALTERLRGAANAVVGNCGIDELVGCATYDDGCPRQEPSPCKCLLDMIFVP